MTRRKIDNTKRHERGTGHPKPYLQRIDLLWDEIFALRHENKMLREQIEDMRRMENEGG